MLDKTKKNIKTYHQRLRYHPGFTRHTRKVHWYSSLFDITYQSKCHKDVALSSDECTPACGICAIFGSFCLISKVLQLTQRKAFMKCEYYNHSPVIRQGQIWLRLWLSYSCSPCSGLRLTTCEYSSNTIKVLKCVCVFGRMGREGQDIIGYFAVTSVRIHPKRC